MKFRFRRTADYVKGDSLWKDWFENTPATPHHHAAAFWVHEFRPWFLRWVFKEGE